MGADDDAKKQNILQKIYENNPFTMIRQRDDEQRFDGKTWKRPISEDKWYDFRRNRTLTTSGMDPINWPNSKLAGDMRNIDANTHHFPINGFSNELFGPIGDRSHNKCYDLEKSALGCLEYYGCHRGREICKDYYADYYECNSGHKQILRAMAMRAKRNIRWREWAVGKRDYDTVYIPPPPDGIYKDTFPSPKDHIHGEYSN